MRASIYERYVDRDTDPETILAMSQDQIENQIEDYAREDAIANNPDATEAEIGQYREQAAHEIMLEAQRLIDQRNS